MMAVSVGMDEPGVRAPAAAEAKNGIQDGRTSGCPRFTFRPPIHLSSLGTSQRGHEHAVSEKAMTEGEPMGRERARPVISPRFRRLNGTNRRGFSSGSFTRGRSIGWPSRRADRSGALLPRKVQRTHCRSRIEECVPLPRTSFAKRPAATAVKGALRVAVHRGSAGRLGREGRPPPDQPEPLPPSSEIGLDEQHKLDEETLTLEGLLGATPALARRTRRPRALSR